MIFFRESGFFDSLNSSLVYWVLDKSLSEVAVETGLSTQAIREQSAAPGTCMLSASLEMIRSAGRCCAFSACATSGLTASCRIRPGQHRCILSPLREERSFRDWDIGGSNVLDSGVAQALVAALGKNLASFDVVIVNQQLSHGFHTEALRSGLCSLIPRSSLPFSAHSRAFSDSYAGAIRKLGDRAASDCSACDAGALRAVGQAGLCNSEASGNPRPRGAWGLRGSWARHHGKVDLVGTGDSAVAAVAPALTVRRRCEEAAGLANLAAAASCSPSGRPVRGKYLL